MLAVPDDGDQPGHERGDPARAGGSLRLPPTEAGRLAHPTRVSFVSQELCFSFLL